MEVTDLGKARVHWGKTQPGRVQELSAEEEEEISYSLSKEFCCKAEQRREQLLHARSMLGRMEPNNGWRMQERGERAKELEYLTR